MVNLEPNPDDLSQLEESYIPDALLVNELEKIIAMQSLKIKELEFTLEAAYVQLKQLKIKYVYGNDKNY